MRKEIRVAAERRGDQMWMVVRFPYDPSIVKIVRAISGSQYSRMEKYWYFPIRTASFDALIKKLKFLPGTELFIDENLSRYGLVGTGTSNALSPDHVKGLDDLVCWMTSKRYSPQTIETNTGAMGREMLSVGEVMVRD